MHIENIQTLIINEVSSKKRNSTKLQGNELEETDGIYRANYWQGKFPDEDMGSDGFQYKTAPGKSFSHGLF